MFVFLGHKFAQKARIHASHPIKIEIVPVSHWLQRNFAIANGFHLHLLSGNLGLLAVDEEDGAEAVVLLVFVLAKDAASFDEGVAFEEFINLILFDLIGQPGHFQGYFISSSYYNNK